MVAGKQLRSNEASLSVKKANNNRKGVELRYTEDYMGLEGAMHVQRLSISNRASRES
jgi:hypothetical protein